MTDIRKFLIVQSAIMPGCPLRFYMHDCRVLLSRNMLNRFVVICSCAMLVVSTRVYAQFSYTIDQSVPVKGPSRSMLKNPWAGGLNAAQFNTIHLNADQAEDLVLFDRMANKVLTFINDKGAWRYAPEYEEYFPKEITNWLLLKDFNADGRKDIFCGDALGVKVYRNVSAPGGLLEWKRVIFFSTGGLPTDILLTKGFTQKTNLQLQYDDLPTIVDADNDGDLDIFNVRFTGNGSVEYHKNFSRERYGSADSLDFERQTQAWGGFTQCKCERFAYNEEECSFTSGRLQHAGGKALLAIDLDGDRDHEILFSEAECSSIYSLTNHGTVAAPVINSVQRFPPSRPVDINIFPAVFNEDVDLDGLKDIIASPNIYRKDLASQDLRKSTWFYKNVGTSAVPSFQFVRDNYLQGEMIDVGDDAVPAFFDIDGDTDLDLFISNNSDSASTGSVHFFRNTGSSTDPAFEFVTNDFASIRSLSLTNVRIQFADLTSDGKPDLCFLGVDARAVAKIFYLPNRGEGENFRASDVASITFGIAPQENFHFTDIDHDGRIDLLAVRAVGALEYWRNSGTPGLPSFSISDRAYLGFAASTSRRPFAISTADLDSDGTQDMIIADQFGSLSVIEDFHNSSASNALTDIAFNPLLEKYVQPSFGKCWPVAANLFRSARPAIVAGNIRGGLTMLRNEEKDLGFNELLLTVHPNPAEQSGTFFVDTNLPLSLDIFNSLGQSVQRGLPVAFGRNELRLQLAAGIYILRFSDGNGVVSRRLVVR